jgi:hypothetical protein
MLSQQVSIEDSRLGLAMAERVEMNDSTTIVLLARDVHGSVNTVLDTRGAALAGIIAGVVVGLVLTALRGLTRKSS